MLSANIVGDKFSLLLDESWFNNSTPHNFLGGVIGIEAGALSHPLCLGPIDPGLIFNRSYRWWTWCLLLFPLKFPPSPSMVQYSVSHIPLHYFNGYLDASHEFPCVLFVGASFKRTKLASPEFFTTNSCTSFAPAVLPCIVSETGIAKLAIEGQNFSTSKIKVRKKAATYVLICY